MRVLLGLVVIAFVASAAPAYGTTRIPLSPLPDASVGRVDGTRAFIAVSVRGDRLRVYVCDGTLRRDATISVWFKRRWDGRSPITIRRGGHVLHIDRVRGGRIAGTLDGTHRFRVRPAKTPAGLFRGHKRALSTTWIVLPGRAKRGTFVPTRPRKCRLVLVSGANGQSQWVSVCG
jgi:hypothetical protein